MSNKLLKKLINKINLGILEEEPIRVSGGLLNRIYKVNTSTGIYAIKHLNPEVMKRKNAKENHIIAERIANSVQENGINCIPAKVFQDGALQEIDGNYFFVFDWFEGKAIDETEITMEHVKKVSTLLAKLHNINLKNFREASERS